MTSSPRHPRTPARFFIAFEGPEGAGKSTQVAHLSTRLRNAGIDVVRTREPGGTPAGDRIRSVILDPDLDMAPMTEFLLLSASRAQLVRDVVVPALESGRTVLSDRFSGASLAYQGYGRGLDRTFIRTLSDRVTQGVEPDLTLLLDLDVETGMGRIATRGMRDRLERADEGFHQRVRAGFLEIATERPTWHVLDAAAPEATLAEHVWNVVASRHPALAAGGRGASDERGGSHASDAEPPQGDAPGDPADVPTVPEDRS